MHRASLLNPITDLPRLLTPTFQSAKFPANRDSEIPRSSRLWFSLQTLKSIKKSIASPFLESVSITSKTDEDVVISCIEQRATQFQGQIPVQRLESLQVLTYPLDPQLFRKAPPKGPRQEVSKQKPILGTFHRSRLSTALNFCISDNRPPKTTSSWPI